MTLATLRLLDPHDNVYFVGAYTLPTEPGLSVVGGTTALADQDDATYVSLDARGAGAFVRTPWMVARVPALPNVASIQSLAMMVRLSTADNPDTPSGYDGYLYANAQVFRWLGGGTLPDPYDLTLTQTISNYDWNPAILFTSGYQNLGVPLAGPGTPITPTDLIEGRLYLRWMHLQNVANIQYLSEAWLDVDYTPATLPPLRQWPRDDGLRRIPPRSGVAGPTSRQGSLRRGPRGNYT